MLPIPEIIHQIWSGIEEPLPDLFRKLGETWQAHYPNWRYEYWDNDRMNRFVKTFYPEYRDAFQRYPYHIQRWDAIRYLILYKTGGMYVDFDYESLKPIDELLKGKSCCFAMEPESHRKIFNRDIIFNNALMAAVPGHPFMQKIIKRVFSEETVRYRDVSKDICVFKTTGPWQLIDLYEQATEAEKAAVYLIPDKYVTPFSVGQTRQLRMGIMHEELDNCLKDAYAVHYFFNSWFADDD